MTNTFLAQSERMDIRLGGGVNIPAATLNAFNTIGIIVLIPVVDKMVYPFFERIRYPLTFLKRIGGWHCGKIRISKMHKRKI